MLAGNDPIPYLNAMLAMAGEGGMLPEQIWDAEPIEARHLIPGRPTGSAMPLAWAHAEFVKLAYSYLAGSIPIDRPKPVWDRYQGQRPIAKIGFWLQQAPISKLHTGMKLYIGLHQPSLVRWGINNWQSIRNISTWDSGIGLHIAEIDTSRLPAGESIEFTYRRNHDGVWAGGNFQVTMR